MAFHEKAPPAVPSIQDQNLRREMSPGRTTCNCGYLHRFMQCAGQHGRGLPAALRAAETHKSPPALHSTWRAVVLQGEGEPPPPPQHPSGGGPRCFVKGKAITVMEIWNITGMLLIRLHAERCCVKI